MPFCGSFVVVRTLWSESERLEWLQGEGLRQLLLEFFRGCCGDWKRPTEPSKVFPMKALGLKEPILLPSAGHSLNVSPKEVPALGFFLKPRQSESKLY